MYIFFKRYEISDFFSKWFSLRIMNFLGIYIGFYFYLVVHFNQSSLNELKAWIKKYQLIN